MFQKTDTAAISHVPGIFTVSYEYDIAALSLEPAIVTVCQEPNIAGMSQEPEMTVISQEPDNVDMTLMLNCGLIYMYLGRRRGDQTYLTCECPLHVPCHVI